MNVKRKNHEVGTSQDDEVCFDPVALAAFYDLEGFNRIVQEFRRASQASSTPQAVRCPAQVAVGSSSKPRITVSRTQSFVQAQKQWNYLDPRFA